MVRISATRKWQIFGLICLSVAAFFALYSQNIIFPYTTQEMVNQIWVSVMTDLLGAGIVAFITIYIIKRFWRRR